MTIAIDPEFRDLLMPLTPDERAGLESRILAEGCRDPLVVWSETGILLDGHNRYSICTAHGLPYRLESISLPDRHTATNWIINNQLSRRNATPDQITYLMGKRYERENQGHGGDRKSKGQTDPLMPTADRLADEYKVSPKTVKRAAAFTRSVDALAEVAGADVRAAILSRDARIGREEAVKLAKAAQAAPDVAPAVVAEVLTGKTDADEAIRLLKRAAPEPPRTITVVPVPTGMRLEVADASDLPLADASVDIVVTSPPYNLDKKYAASIDKSESWYYLMGVWLGEMYRVTRPGGRLAINVPLDTTLGGYRPTWPQACQAAVAAGWEFQHTIVWNEGNVSKSTARGSIDSPAAPRIIAPVEVVGVFSKGEWSRRSETPPDLTHDEWLEWTNGLWTFPGESRAWEGHPAPFPAELPRRLIKLLSFPGDVILDPFVGSGTTAIVAARLGRQVYGYDISEAYIESARRRVAAQERSAA